jgi:hypothetical protein
MSVARRSILIGVPRSSGNAHGATISIDVLSERLLINRSIQSLQHRSSGITRRSGNSLTIIIQDAAAELQLISPLPALSLYFFVIGLALRDRKIGEFDGHWVKAHPQKLHISAV